MLNLGTWEAMETHFLFQSTDGEIADRGIDERCEKNEPDTHHVATTY
jgi:hypothetical protein